MKVSVKRDNGMLKVDIDGTLYAPLSFKSFRPNPRNISEFYGAGVRLFSVLSSGIISALGVPYSLFGESWTGEGRYDFSAVDRQMDMFIENAPDGFFAPMFQVDTRPWYLETHPEVPDSFLCLSQIAHDGTWRKAAADYLKAVIRHCEEKYGDRIYGYFILGGGTTEWLSDHDHEEPHPIKEAAYKKYRNDAGTTLPTKEELEKDGRVFLEPEEENVLCERRFHADTIADLVLYFAAEVQSVIRHQKLLGLYYGYLMELGAPRLYNAGHLGYEKVFFSDDIDMISSPSAYRYRELTDPSAFMVTQKTLDAHNKLYFLEFDHITHVAPSMVEEAPSGNSRNGTLKIIPGAEKRCNNESESLNLMYRDFLLCYANATALWWFDMFDGWFRSEGMMNAVQRMIALHGELSDLSKESVAQIAVYAEGEALYHVRKSAKLANESLSKMLRTFAEMGAPYDIYSIGDLDACSPERYRMILLIDEFDIPQKRMETIRRLQREGVTVVWFYAPDYAHGAENDVKRITRATGIGVQESGKSHGGLVAHGKVTENVLAAPYFSVADEKAVPIGFFEDGAVAVAGNADETVFYSAVPYLPSSVLGGILDRKGIFRYSRNPHVYTYVNAGAVGVYNATQEDATVFVPEDGTYTDKLTGSEFCATGGKLLLPFRDFRAYLLVKNRQDAEGMEFPEAF